VQNLHLQFFIFIIIIYPFLFIIKKFVDSKSNIEIIVKMVDLNG